MPCIDHGGHLWLLRLCWHLMAPSIPKLLPALRMYWNNMRLLTFDYAQLSVLVFDVCLTDSLLKTNKFSLHNISNIQFYSQQTDSNCGNNIRVQSFPFPYIHVYFRYTRIISNVFFLLSLVSRCAKRKCSLNGGMCIIAAIRL